MSHAAISKTAAIAAAVLVPLAYLYFYTPYGMDTTDFGYFYAYAWRILQGQVPYRDFFYIKPAFPLYWHAFWLWLTPFKIQLLAGKVGFCLSMLTAAWLGSLYLNKILHLCKLALPVPLLATCAFVFSIHSFPHMPWHTADGVLFSSAALYAAFSGFPILGGMAAAAATLCKQSFIFVPLAVICTLFCYKKPIRLFIAAFLSAIFLWCLWLHCNGAWQNFREMTTGQLDINEALDAGIYIYLKQNWLIPLTACIPALLFHLFHKRLPAPLTPAWCYLVCLTTWYIFNVFSQQTWIGYGASWPTLFMLLGLAIVLVPAIFLLPYADAPSPIAISCAYAAALLIAWSAAISGGYKIPAFFAAPLILSFLLCHNRAYGPTLWLAWATLLTGLIIFAVGWQYPYTFPIRPLAKSDLVYDAGMVYPQATGVKIDQDMLERLQELKELRKRYGTNYKTLPGFSLAYYLNGDTPIISSDWLIDWEINGQIDRVFQELEDKNTVVFMERDQLDIAQADGYARAGYGVPQRIRHQWRIVEQTPHFVIFQKR